MIGELFRFRTPAAPFEGSYHHYYEASAEAVRTGGQPPVTAEEGTRTIAVLDAVRTGVTERLSRNDGSVTGVTVTEQPEAP